MKRYDTMRSAILDADKVIIFLTPEYKIKAEEAIGGVGFESSIINKEL